MGSDRSIAAKIGLHGGRPDAEIGVRQAGAQPGGTRGRCDDARSGGADQGRWERENPRKLTTRTMRFPGGQGIGVFSATGGARPPVKAMKGCSRRSSGRLRGRADCRVCRIAPVHLTHVMRGTPADPGQNHRPGVAGKRARAVRDPGRVWEANFFRVLRGAQRSAAAEPGGGGSCPAAHDRRGLVRQMGVGGCRPRQGVKDTVSAPRRALSLDRRESAVSGEAETERALGGRGLFFLQLMCSLPGRARLRRLHFIEAFARRIIGWAGVSRSARNDFFARCPEPGPSTTGRPVRAGGG